MYGRWCLAMRSHCPNTIHIYVALKKILGNLIKENVRKSELKSIRILTVLEQEISKLAENYDPLNEVKYSFNYNAPESRIVYNLKNNMISIYISNHM